MQHASKSLMDTLGEVYESNWVGHDLLYVQAQNQEMLWADLAHKLTDQVLIPLNTYQVSGCALKAERKVTSLTHARAHIHTRTLTPIHSLEA